MPDPAQQEKRWLSIALAALYLDVHPQSVRNLLRTGELKVALIGGVYRLDRLEIDKYLERGMKVLPPYQKGTRPWVRKNRPWLKAHVARRRNAKRAGRQDSTNERMVPR